MNTEVKKENQLGVEDSSMKNESKRSTPLCTTNSKLSQQKPIELQGSVNKSEPKRDYYGTIIDKEKHQQHVVFRDIVPGMAVADIREVECYKQYNLMEDEPEEIIEPKCNCKLL